MQRELVEERGEWLFRPWVARMVESRSLIAGLGSFGRLVLVDSDDLKFPVLDWETLRWVEVKTTRTVPRCHIVVLVSGRSRRPKLVLVSGTAHWRRGRGGEVEELRSERESSRRGREEGKRRRRGRKIIGAMEERREERRKGDRRLGLGWRERKRSHDSNRGHRHRSDAGWLRSNRLHTDWGLQLTFTSVLIILVDGDSPGIIPGLTTRQLGVIIPPVAED